MILLIVLFILSFFLSFVMWDVRWCWTENGKRLWKLYLFCLLSTLSCWTTQWFLVAFLKTNKLLSWHGEEHIASSILKWIQQLLPQFMQHIMPKSWIYYYFPFRIVLKVNCRSYSLVFGPRISREKIKLFAFYRIESRKCY